MSSFDPKKMLKQTGLNPKDKLLSALNSKASNMTSKLSGEVASKLAQAGQSLSSATRFAASKTDALLSSAPEAFSSMASLGGGTPAIERISRSDLFSLRGGGEIAFDPQSVIPDAQEAGSYTDSKVFPADLTQQDYMMTFEFMEYKRPKLTESANTEVRFTISLPIPNTLLESYGVSYSEGKYGATLGNIINDYDANGLNRNEINMSGATGIGVARGAFQGALANAAGSATGAFGVDTEGLSGAADQVFGSIVNPHVSLFFQGVSLREHQFSWALAPRNAQDARNIREIYYRIKRSALPTFTPEASFTTLEYPMMVRVRIFTKGGKELYPFKMCVIPGINMNHAASGVPSFHADGAPVLQQMSMTLKEIEYFTSDDIKKFQGAEYESFEADFVQNQIALEGAEEFLTGLSASANGLSQAVINDPALRRVGFQPPPTEEAE